MTKEAKDATYVGPPVRVRETKGDSVREFTTTRIEEGEDLEVLDGTPALDDEGNFLDEVVTKVEDQAPVDNRSAAETPQPVTTETGVPSAPADSVKQQEPEDPKKGKKTEGEDGK